MATVTCGIDLGGTKIQAVVLRHHRVAGQNRVATPRDSARAVITAMAGSVRASLQEAGAQPSDLVRVGVGSPGEIQAEAGAVSHANNVPGFGGRVRVAEQLSRALGGVPVVLDNDVRVAILGEFHRGAGRPYKNLLGVFVGTGVGGGLILNGELREGRGAAGEIGHTVVRPGGRECSCGRKGCLEAYAGRGRMEFNARRWAADGRKTILFDLMRKDKRDRLTSGVIAAALDRKDRMAVGLVDDAVWALGIALASAQNLLDLEAIIIGGGLGDRLGRSFVDRVAAAMKPRLFVDQHPPQMLTTELGDLAGAVGAAVLAGG
ncbi:MAG TPA: ROK family protein [Candidatus Acidoferrales bacterium]|nr:ROK family protein [Candidatus Acidoferrales bacterium]